LVVALAAAALYQVSVSSSLSGAGSGLALLAPALLATAVGMLAIRLAARIARGSTRRAPRGIGGLLVWRRLARVPSRLRRDVLVAIAAAVAVFAVQLVGLAGRNELLRAQAQIGAPTVFHVHVPAGKSLLDIVRAADPAGTQAMAAAERDAPTDGGTSRVVAVDTSRLARISPWRAGWAGMTPQQLAAALHPPAPIPPVILTGSRIELTVQNVSITSGDGTDLAPARNSAVPAMQISLVVADRAGWHTVTLGVLAGDRQQATVAAPLPCPAGCRLVRVTFAAAESGHPYTAKLDITQLKTDVQRARTFGSLLSNTAAWQAVPAAAQSGLAGATAAPSSAGLHLAVQDLQGYAAPALAPTDVPDPLPALIGRNVDPPSVPGLPAAVPGVGLDDQTQLLSPVGMAAVVPRALDNGVLVDLADATALADTSKLVTDQEVWLAPGSHPAIERALAAAGVAITGTDTVAAAHAVIVRAGPARAVLANLALIALAGLLTVAALAAAQLIAAAERRQLWTAAAIAGLPRRVIRRAVLLELAVPATVGTLLGAGGGLAAVLLAGARLPLFAAGTVGPPLDTVPDWPLLALTAGVAIAAVLVFAAVSAWLQAAVAGRGR